MAVEYASFPEVKTVVKVLKDKFSAQLAHINPESILYLSFSKPKSAVKGRIGPVPKRFAHLFPDQDYFIEIHKESWLDSTEAERLYVILHELLHIPEEGFVNSSKEYRKTVKHDIQDFKALVKIYGIEGENLDKLAKAVR